MCQSLGCVRFWKLSRTYLDEGPHPLSFSTHGRLSSLRVSSAWHLLARITPWWDGSLLWRSDDPFSSTCSGAKATSFSRRLKLLFFTTFTSKVRFRHEIWTVSGDLSLEIELIGLQNETKVDLLLQLWKFRLY